ncbi:MAG: hypothetical protein O3B95_07705 [Chloroflexi bacterium]|nr:hypothetical protein [Chloroflexota bacterium]
MRITGIVKLILLLAVIAGSTGVYGFSTTQANEKSETGTFVEIDGVRSAISSGSVVARGTALDDGVCDVPDFELIGVVSNDSPTFEIEVELNEQCEAVVTTARVKGRYGDGFVGAVREALTPNIAKATTTEKRITGEYALHDAPHLCLSCVEAEVDYYDDGSDVWGGHNTQYDCHALQLTGWWEQSCSSVSSSLSGLSSISHKATGEFENIIIPGNDFQIWTEVTASLGGNGVITCTRSGSFNTGAPLVTHWSCFGGINPV